MPRTAKKPEQTQETEPIQVQNVKEEPTKPMARKCSFDPTKYLVPIIGQNGVEGHLIPVKDRVLWFNIWCEENGVKGVIDDSEGEFFPPTPIPGYPLFYSAKCTITMDGEVVAKSKAAAPINFQSLPDYYNGMKTLATQAKGRALGNCGFGWGSASSEEGDINGPLYEQGMAVQNTQTSASQQVMFSEAMQPQVPMNQSPAQQAAPSMEPVQQQNPAPVAAVSVSAPEVNTPTVEKQESVQTVAPSAEKTQPAAPSVSDAPAPVFQKKRTTIATPPRVFPPEENPFHSLEEAQNFRIPSGEYQGMSLLEMKEQNPKLFEFCVKGQMKAPAWRAAVYAAQMIDAAAQE